MENAIFYTLVRFLPLYHMLSESDGNGLQVLFKLKLSNNVKRTDVADPPNFPFQNRRNYINFLELRREEEVLSSSETQGQLVGAKGFSQFMGESLLQQREEGLPALL